jgi:NAD(P)H-dependent FMN reductase
MKRRSAIKITLVYGTAAPAGRLFGALECFQRAIAARAESTILDLSTTALPSADGAPIDALPEAARTALNAVAASDGVAVFAPVYRATAPGTLKNLFDLLPLEFLENKVTGMVSMGATPHHYLAVDTDLRPILAWFGAVSMPSSLYLTSQSFEAGKLTAEAQDNLQRYANSFLDMCERLSGLIVRPRPLAAGHKG